VVDKDIDGNRVVQQGTPACRGKIFRIAGAVGHYDQEIHVAVAVGRSVGMGAEKVDLLRVQRGNQPLDHFAQHCFRKHLHTSIIPHGRPELSDRY
jgi:hypothetical protein